MKDNFDITKFNNIAIDFDGIIIEGNESFLIGKPFKFYLKANYRKIFEEILKNHVTTIGQMSINDFDTDQVMLYFVFKDNYVVIYFLPDNLDSILLERNELLNINQVFGDSYFIFDADEQKIIKKYDSSLSFDCIDSDYVDENNSYFVEPESKDELDDFLFSLKKPRGKKTLNIRFRTSKSTNYDWYCFEFAQQSEVNLFLARFRNVQQSITEREEFIRKSLLDPLTKILQKDAVQSQINEFLYSRPAGNHILMMIDIDFFKNINDTFGHIFGDQVIKTIASSLKKIVGRNGKLGRFGGDEFMVFMSNIDTRDDIKSVARKIRYALDNLTIKGHPFRCSCTIGITQYPKDGNDFESLLKKADKALYRGKRKGRDCHIIYDEELHGNIIPNLDLADYSAFTIDNRADFIEHILEPLISAKDFKDGINKALNETRDFFNLSKVGICQFKDSMLKPLICYYGEKLDCLDNILFTEKMKKEWGKLFTLDNIAFFNDSCIYRTSHPDLFNLLKKYGLDSGILALMKNNNEVTGVLYLGMINERRVWQRDEIFHFSIISKLINVYFNKVD